jgi:hypothetical protein
MAELEPRRIWKVLEEAFILLSIFAIWPGILGWEGWHWEAVKYLAVVGLVWIFVRRMRRYKDRTDQSSTP